ncbi:related to lysyl-tRNA synthetase [Cephalotrichum gorgonifer]|uniref:Lysyl-tRNA synthetase n=1 Tax=Cephalotrichum gorgonifer TaxID=2041049 RepID=A0AAE8MZW9_9PEZI|nr:related to lysyl-tRNA synthetase [Cephalotrichum gorgonifer]
MLCPPGIMKSLQCIRGQTARISRCLPPRVPARASASAQISRARPRSYIGVPARSLSGTSRVWGNAEASTDAEPLDYKQQRLERLASAQDGEDALFKEPFPRLEHRTGTMSVADFLDTHKDVEAHDPNSDSVTLYGRVRSLRRHGANLMFIDIVNQFHSVQAMINWSAVHQASGLTKQQFKLFAKMIEKGDHISVTGRPTRTSTGQLSIAAVELPELLAPALEPIPDKLIDPDKKIQRRHLDMIVNPEVADTLRLRAAILSYLRQFLNDRQFLEFQTPIVADNAGGAAARPFTTTATEFPSKELALRIAPELWLKRLVVGGVHNVFEIGPAFRNEGIDGTHNPEFTMCEFYSAYTNLGDLIRRTEDMISGLAQHCQELISTQLTSLPAVDTNLYAPPFRYVEFVPALEKALGFHLPNLASETALPDLITVLKLANVHIPGGAPATLPKLLDRLGAMYLEPLSFEGPLFITHHPSCMSPLSKSFVCPKTRQEVSARAELFVAGRELANMYEEENDPDLQLQKMVEFRRRAQAAAATGEGEMMVEDGLPPRASAPAPAPEVANEDEAPPADLSYIQALRAGLPPTGGWGCGVERLVMLFSGAKRISDCLAFGSLKNVVSLNAGAEEEVMASRGLSRAEGVGRSKLEEMNRRILAKESGLEE